MGKYAYSYDELKPTKVDKGFERRIVSTEKLMLVTAEFSDGPCEFADPLHRHPHEQVSCMVQGEIFLLVEGEKKVLMKPGDCFAIPSNVPHAIHRLTSYVKIIDCFTPIREDFI